MSVKKIEKMKGKKLKNQIDLSYIGTNSHSFVFLFNYSLLISSSFPIFSLSIFLYEVRDMVN